MRRRPFLTAEWRNLAMVNYSVPPELLAPHLPPGMEPDIRDGRAWCSLVAFQFLHTRVLGVKWPGFVHFPEWNLRFYVRRGDQRGVCFVKEYVPQRWVAMVANTLYGEPYVAARIGQEVGRTPSGNMAAAYRLHLPGGTNHIEIEAANEARLPPEGGIEDWYKEQEWGFGTLRSGRPIRYRVEHPRWRVHPTTGDGLRARLDWGAMYGNRWAAMNTVAPDSVMLVEGSPVKVFPYELL